jgi:hypothetical protein
VPRLSYVNLDRQPEPLEQPAVGIRLEAPYAIELRGRLLLSFESDSFVDDPAIQFASGGRSVDFRVPANETEAVFGDSQKQVQFQVGTVAGTLKLQAALTVGSVNVTPSPAPSTSFQIAASPPKIRDLRLGARTANEIELLVTGYSTTRSLQSLTFQFAGAPGSRLDTPQLTANVDGAFANWYQSAASRSFGGQFTASIRFVVSGDANAVQSITVTAANANGTSASSSVSLR